MMSKFLTALFALVFTLQATASYGPVSIKGQADASAEVLTNLQVPNGLATKTGNRTWLMESGNNNILTNPSFEHQTASTGWTNSAGTVAAETSVKIHGEKSLKITLSSEALTLYQDSTRYQAQFADGVQGLAYVWVKTSVSSIYVCQRSAGVSLVSSTFSYCVAVNNDNKWGLYKLPVVLGGTSNGIEIASYNSLGVSTAVTGDVYVDGADLATSEAIETVDDSKLAGESYFAGTTSCTWTRTSTTIGAFTATAACPGPTVTYSNLGEWQTTDANLPRQTINNLPAGTYKATFILASFTSTVANTAFAINDGTTTCAATHGEGNTVVGAVTVQCVFNYSTSGNRSFELYTASTTGTVTVQNGVTSPQVNSRFILEYYGSQRVYSSQCGASCENHLTGSSTSAGVVADTLDWINGNASISSTAVYDLTPTTGTFTTTPNCGCSNNNDGECSYVKSSSSNTSLRFATENSSGTLTASSFTFWCDKAGADFTATRTITGSFKEVPKTPGFTNPKTCYIWNAGASNTTSCTSSPCTEYFDSCGTASACTRSGVGNYSCQWGNGTWAANSYLFCGGSTGTFEVAERAVISDANGSSGAIATNTLNSSGAAVDSYFSYWCTGAAP
jgi:hypothetical protein